MCGSDSSSLANFSSFFGSSITMLMSTGSVCCMLMLPMSHSMTSSITCVVTGGNSLKGNYPNYFPSSSGCNLMSSSISISLYSVSAKVFQIPGMYSNVMFCASSSQLFTFEFIMFFSKNFFNGRWSLFTVIFAVSM